LLVMRMSTAEARRFGDVAALLRAESEALETRIRTVNGEIALARSFLAENARELESIGRSSAAKLTTAAQQLVEALADSDQKAQVLESVSSAAVTNVELLRNHLPVVTSAAKDTANQIGNAGNIANDHIQSLIASMRTMDEAVASTSSKMDQMERQSASTAQNMQHGVQSASELLNASLNNSQDTALAMLAKLHSETKTVEQRIGEASENISALSESSAQLLSDQLAQLENAVSQVATATTNNSATVLSVVANMDAALDDSARKLAAMNDDAGIRFENMIGKVGASMTDCNNQLGAIDANATDRIAKLAFAINALSESSSELGVNLAANEDRAATVLVDAEKMLATLGAVSTELGDALPSAFAQLQHRLTDNMAVIGAVRAEGDALAQQATGLKASFAAIDTLLHTQKGAIDGLLNNSGSALAERQTEISALMESLQSTQGMIDQVSANAEQHLNGSLRRVADAAHEAAQQSKVVIETEFADIGERLTEQNRMLLAGAIDAQVAEMGNAVKEAIDRNISLSEEATRRVTAQLQSVNELTSNLEQRVAVAKEQFDGIDDEAFARRISLLTESLNSAAIDVAKILSNEVTDTAWAAYLKGDRGVFTRRAVRLLDSGEARVIANHYDDDTEFRDHVNRYIHDFEAMMRVLLSTRDGNAIGVTLLSSDVGKLYVALAQAIDRLRN
jgi:myosin heavy subunit